MAGSKLLQLVVVTGLSMCISSISCDHIYTHSNRMLFVQLVAEEKVCTKHKLTFKLTIQHITQRDLSLQLVALCVLATEVSNSSI